MKKKRKNLSTTNSLTRRQAAVGALIPTAMKVSTMVPKLEPIGRIGFPKINFTGHRPDQTKKFRLTKVPLRISFSLNVEVYELEARLRRFDFSIFSKVRESLRLELLMLHRARKQNRLYRTKMLDDDELDYAAAAGANYLLKNDKNCEKYKLDQKTDKKNVEI